MKNTSSWLALSGCALLAGIAFWAYCLAVSDTPAEKGRLAGRPQAAAPILASSGVRPAPGRPPPMPGGPDAWPMPDEPSLASEGEAIVQDTGGFIDADSPVPPQTLGGAAAPVDTGPFIDADSPPH